MASRTSNPHLALWIAATGLSHGEIARRVAAEAVRQGHRQITPDATRVRRWIDGERPRPPVSALLAAVLSETVGQPLTPGDLGLTAAGAVLDTIQVPLLTEAAAQTLAGWTQMDLFMDRRETLKLAVGAPLILAAERMLGGIARPLNRAQQGFGTDTVTALEEVTAFFTRADATKGGGLYRSAIVAQLRRSRPPHSGRRSGRPAGPGLRRDRRPGRARRMGQPRLRPVCDGTALLELRHLRGGRGRAARPRGGDRHPHVAPDDLPRSPARCPRPPRSGRCEG